MTIDPDLSLHLSGTPYSLGPAAAKALREAIHALQERICTLRSVGTLTAETLKQYYGEKRFEQVAESNAIEGSTLSVGETEIAIMKGITLAGHDPAYVRDARALDDALQALTEMAREPGPTTMDDLNRMHGLILGDRPGAGMFRRQPVTISGSNHRPPKTWAGIMDAMEEWEAWSVDHAQAPAIIRAVVLHAWLVHIHPYIDGNGRTTRALTNLELVRAGYPPIIIKRTLRRRYISALQESDAAGDLSSLFDLMLDRMEGAVRGLELSANKQQAYDPIAIKIRQKQERRLKVWNTAIDLFHDMLVERLADRVEPNGGIVETEDFGKSLELDGYVQLCQGRSIPKSWCFRLRIHVPGAGDVERLLWIGYRDDALLRHMGSADGPAALWSVRNPDGYPPWTAAEERAPAFTALTIHDTHGDRWVGHRTDGSIVDLDLSSVVDQTATALIEQLD